MKYIYARGIHGKDFIKPSSQHLLSKQVLHIRLSSYPSKSLSKYPASISSPSSSVQFKLFTMAIPTLVKTFHADTYPAINATLPQLSTKSKNIVISGGGSGIGPEIAR